VNSPATGLDAESRDEIAASLRHLFEQRAESHDFAPLLAEFGWAELLKEDPCVAINLLFHEQGRALAGSRALDDVLLAQLPHIETTARRRAVVYPHPPDGVVLRPRDGALRGIVLGSLDDVDEAVIPHTCQDGTIAVAVTPAAELATATAPLGGFDQHTGWRTISGWRTTGSHTVAVGPAWDLAVAAGRRALAAEILGVCDAARELVVAHASARVQFGRPIGSFQAVRHRLAEAEVAIAGARSVLGAAWQDPAGPSGVWTAMVAKLRAGHAQAVLMRHAVQTFGAMGLTRESPLHSYVERAAALDALLGGRRPLTEEVGSALLGGTEADFELP
jgi:Acyl-CoA dehydrogenase, C-terminal domain